MRRVLVVAVWVVATVGVTYVANAAVELVDLQVFPQGARIEVLARAQPAPTTMPRMRSTTTRPPATTAAPVATTTAPVATTAAPAATTAVPVPTTAVPVATTAVPAPTTTGPLAPTTTVDGSPTTTAAPVATTTTTRPPATTTTTRPPATTTTAVPVPPLVVATASLPEARVGEDYAVGLVASGGVPPYTWSLVGGVLPQGVGLSQAGTLSGVPAASVDATLVFAVSDSSGRSASSAALEFATAADRRTVAARGGTVFVDGAGDSVSLFLASPADGFSAVIVEPGGFRVEVQFVPLQGDATSWVVCEVAASVVCSHG